MREKIKHIAIILDGNRRWAKKHNLPKYKGHEKGFQKIKDLLKWCIGLNIKEITLYCFSTENFGRSRQEVGFLFNLLRDKFSNFFKSDLIHKNKVRVCIIGKPSMFPKDIQKMMQDIMKKTKNYNRLKINLALGYGGRSEIIDAINKILKNNKTKKVSENLLKKYLYLKDEPDLLIRPGGEKRLSNFLTWQAVYTELIFMDKYWPDFTKNDIVNCIKEYQKRQRRFGR